jgi:hypothetical protein
MRYSVLIGLYLLVCSLPASAQITYGVRAGVNLADVSFSDGPEVPTKGRVGPTIGVFARIPVWGRLSVQPEAIYSVKGSSLEAFDLKTSYLVDYLEVPVLLRFPVTRTVHVLGGPAFASRLRARSRTEFGGSTEEVDISDDVERFDLGIAAGAGIAFGRWILDGRVTYGLSDTDADPSDEVKIRNRAFSLSAGFTF